MESPDETPNLPALRVSGSGLPQGDRVKVALVESKASSDQVNMVLWLLGHAKQRQIMSYNKVGELIGYDGSTISRLFNGKYGADMETICRAIRKYKGSLPLTDSGDIFVEELSVVRDVTKICDLARETRTMALLFGENQSGKSEALRHYAKVNNHGRTIYARVPVGGGSAMMLDEILRACSISDRNAYSQKRDRVLRHIDASMLLIVDELHQAIIGRSLKVTTIELVREIHDICRCGVVMCGTNVLQEAIQDVKYGKLLGQTDNRSIFKRRIPATPTKRDVRLLCEAYALPLPEGDAKKIVDQVVSTNGIGKLCKKLIAARLVAEKENQPLSWSFFLKSEGTLARWAKGERSKKEEAEE